MSQSQHGAHQDEGWELLGYAAAAQRIAKFRDGRPLVWGYASAPGQTHDEAASLYRSWLEANGNPLHIPLLYDLAPDRRFDQRKAGRLIDRCLCPGDTIVAACYCLATSPITFANLCLRLNKRLVTIVSHHDYSWSSKVLAESYGSVAKALEQHRPGPTGRMDSLWRSYRSELISKRTLNPRVARLALFCWYLHVEKGRGICFCAGLVRRCRLYMAAGLSQPPTQRNIAWLIRQAELRFPDQNYIEQTELLGIPIHSLPEACERLINQYGSILPRFSRCAWLETGVS